MTVEHLCDSVGETPLDNATPRPRLVGRHGETAVTVSGISSIKRSVNPNEECSVPHSLIWIYSITEGPFLQNIFCSKPESFPSPAFVLYCFLFIINTGEDRSAGASRDARSHLPSFMKPFIGYFDVITPVYAEFKFG